MKRLLLLLLTSCSVVETFDDRNDPPTYAPSTTTQGIAFGITQKADAATAAWSLVRSVSIVDTTDSCVLESLSARPAPPTDANGTATFTGPNLGTGLTVVAGKDQPRGAASAWKTGDLLGFTSQGFSAPSVAVQFEAPSTALKVLTDDGPLVIASMEDFVPHWAPSKYNLDDAVVVSMLTSTNMELRCAFTRDVGHAPIPQSLLSKLGATSGTLSFATRRQEVRTTSDWTVYITATSVIREQPFTLSN